jgi:hypothetical protein
MTRFVGAYQHERVKVAESAMVMPSTRVSVVPTISIGRYGRVPLRIAGSTYFGCFSRAPDKVPRPKMRM